MAKVSFNKLGLKLNVETILLHLTEDIKIEVKQYLPLEEKVQLVQNVVDLSMMEANFQNPMKIELFTNIEIINFYTNITFTEKQKENMMKQYDILVSSGVMQSIIDTIPKDEYQTLKNYILETISSIYNYRNSISGVLEALSTDYNETSFNIEQIIKNLKDPEALQTLKDIAPLVQSD